MQDVKANGTLERDPNFFEKIVGVLMRLGISAGVSVLSGGLLHAYAENTELSTDTGILGSDPLNLSLNKTIGMNGGGIEGNVDVGGIRITGHFNSPKERIQSRLAYFKATLANGDPSR